jgi:predicted dehydrogenase/nucleoside-diphosphate-sugar epimerase
MVTSMPGSHPLRIAFVGAGAMAGHHLQALRRVPTPHQVVGVHDARGGAAEAFAARAGGKARPFTTLPQLLGETRPDLVHICTPAGMHFEAARAALQGGAHVYVEKPFVETPEEAEALFALARERGRLICAGHQLLRDRAFSRLMQGAVSLRPFALVDSTFAFRPPRLDPYSAKDRALAEQLLDIVPHPLYTLVAALESGEATAAAHVVNVSASPTELHALLRAGDVTGRLAISLRARPVASTLTVSGARGSLTADFVRAIVVGAANDGTSPIEKIANPFLEAFQATRRTAASLAGRLLRGADYPGLAELLADFYAAAASGGPSPVSVDHLRRVTAIYQELATHVRRAATPAAARTPVARATPSVGGPLAVLTGAAGFFGQAISRELARRGFRVRGIGRSERPEDPHVHEWVRTDLAEPLAATALAGAAVVVHAAAETGGGFDAHARNTVGATRQVLRAMAGAGVRRMVYVSSISVLRPPQVFWELQTERTPLAARPERLGPYTWGKCAAEELVAASHARREIEARIVRPGALIDWNRIEIPGLLGRRLFGRWHLGLGRPGLPFAACEVGRAATVLAWCADRFADAPPVVNLFDPALRTRRHLLEGFRQHGWQGRMLWVPISFLSLAVTAGRFLVGLARRERARPLAVWSVLRPRRYNPAMAGAVLAAAGETPARRASIRTAATGVREAAYG